tara:strand:+ start:42 stop:305 length:264 start_codon:yes stop_codon:yes gene_type:complete
MIITQFFKVLISTFLLLYFISVAINAIRRLPPLFQDKEQQDFENPVAVETHNRRTQESMEWDIVSYMPNPIKKLPNKIKLEINGNHD